MFMEQKMFKHVTVAKPQNSVISNRLEYQRQKRGPLGRFANSLLTFKVVNIYDNLVGKNTTQNPKA